MIFHLLRAGKRSTARSIIVLSGLLLIAPAALAVEFHVAPDGNDAWSGKLPRPNAARNDGPLASLTGARDAIRHLQQRGELREAVHVVVAEGRYNSTMPLELYFEDTGTKLAPITYEAAKGAHPVFIHGREIHGWEPGTNGIWHTQLPDVAAGRWYFEQLWVNGRRATRDGPQINLGFTCRTSKKNNSAVPASDRSRRRDKL